jgi:uncharacterized tellurite resistance protein B-like protein
MSDAQSTALRARELLRKHELPELPGAEAFAGKTTDDPFFSGMLEAAFLVAGADGQISKEEIGSLSDMVAEVTGANVAPSELAGLVYEFATHLEEEGRGMRIQALANHVPDPTARREVLGFAALIALCDHDLAPSELFVLHSLAKGFGFEMETVNGIIRSIRAALGEEA